MKAISILCCSLTMSLSMLTSASQVDGSDRTLINELYEAYPLASEAFVNPMHPNGQRLDWCKTWGSNCGKSAADEFCRRKGFDTSIGHAQDPRVGLTRVLQDSRMVCWGQPCDSFKFIVCE